MLTDDYDTPMSRRDREANYEAMYDRARLRCMLSLVVVALVWFALLWCIAPSLSRTQTEYYHVKCRLLAWPFVEQRTSSTSIERTNVTTVNGTTGDVRIETSEKSSFAMPTYHVVLYFRSDCAPGDARYTVSDYPRGGTIHVFQTLNASLAQYYVDTEWPPATRTDDALAQPWDLWWTSTGLHREPVEPWETWWLAFSIWYAPSLSVWFFVIAMGPFLAGNTCVSSTGDCSLLPELLRFCRGIRDDKSEKKREFY